LTDEQRSKLLNIDQLYEMASGNLSDSIWAPGNEAKRYNRQASTGTPVSTGRAHNDPSNLSAATMPFNPNTVMNSPSPWFNQQIQPSEFMLLILSPLRYLTFE
jgi:hypothetical protein